MEMQDFTITKRDGSKDRFSLDKIMNAIIIKSLDYGWKCINCINDNRSIAFDV